MSGTNFAVKSQLAKLLAKENITVQHRTGLDTASFNVEERVLWLPVWNEASEDVYDMLVVHEVGHALDTPAVAWKNAIETLTDKFSKSKEDKNEIQGSIHGFLNVIEDARIEKRQKRRYPGSRANFLKAYEHLLAKDFFRIKGKDLKTLLFIDRINLHFKCGVSLGVKFSDAEMAFVNRIEAAETFEEVVKLAEEVYVFSKTELARAREQIKLKGGHVRVGKDDADAEEEISDFDLDIDNDEHKPATLHENIDHSEILDQLKDQEDEESDEEEEKQDETFNPYGNYTLPGQDLSSLEDEVNENPEAPETQMAWEESIKNLVKKHTYDFCYVTPPIPKLKELIDDYKVVMKECHDGLRHVLEPKLKAATRWRKSEESTISFLVKEFEAKKAADIYSRISIAKTGVINTNKLHSYVYNDDIFRRNTVVPQGKNHGFVMLLDWSGSMSDNIQHTLQQIWTMAFFCRRAGIPFEVYTFRTFINQDFHGKWNYDNMGYVEIRSEQETFGWDFRQNKNTLLASPLKLRNILSSRMNGAEFNQMMAYFWKTRYLPKDPMGGTPLNDALLAMPEVLEAFKKRTGVQVVNLMVLTDGGSDCLSGVTKFSQLGYHGKVNYILEDKETRKQYDLGITNYGSSIAGCDTRLITARLLNRIKDRTNANILGFFLENDRGFDSAMWAVHKEKDPSSAERETYRKSWYENGFYSLKTTGYDRYFVLSINKLKEKAAKFDEQHNDVESIADSFIKYSGSKAINRVLLKQFIEEISS